MALQQVVTLAGAQGEATQVVLRPVALRPVVLRRVALRPVVLRPVSSEDAMTADWSRLPHEVIATISTRITNEVAAVNRVVLDVTSKPPGTIEME